METPMRVIGSKIKNTVKANTPIIQRMKLMRGSGWMEKNVVKEKHYMRMETFTQVSLKKVKGMDLV